jgi:superfamily II DNA/RNA helicase
MNQISFRDFSLCREILSAIEQLGYETPTEVQQKVIPLVLENKDLIVRSQTGSGKTAAYTIPICEMVEWLENKPQALILTPTRELALQVKEDVTNIGRLKRIKAIALYGRHPFAIQKTELKQKNHVVVGTPGRILDHIGRGTVALHQIRYLVIDEADEMLNMGFLEQVESILQQLPEERVTMLFSATFPEAVKGLAQRFMITPTDVEIEASGLTVEKIEHVQYRVAEEDKLRLLTSVTTTGNPDSCIIFCGTKERVDDLYQQLVKMKYPCNKLHGGMEQDDRFDTMNEFRKGAFRYLIATDVAARGIDIDNISLIVNYDIPLKKESYVHRTGRTGRAGLEGKAVTFVTSREERYMKEIMEYVGFEIPLLEPPTQEELEEHRPDFDAKLSARPEMKIARNATLNQQIMTLYFNGGKKKKLRATNFVGVISNIEGVTAEDIGIITITETFTHVDILNSKGPLVLSAMKNLPIGGRQLKVSVANKKVSRH